MLNIILFPSSYFYPRRVDEDLQTEYDAVLETGLFEVILFEYNAWFNEGKLKLTNVPEEMSNAVYRGWMMKPEQYKKFYELLLENNICLVNKPYQYEMLHVFPNVYQLLETDTAKMSVYPLYEDIDVNEIKDKYKKFMVKDYVKSVKGTDFPLYFDHTVSQEEFNFWMDKFYKYRGNLLTGGICIKEYLSLKRYGANTNEFRVFYINHEIASVSRNSGQSEYTSLPPTVLMKKYQYLDSLFYTIDYAELEDGTWKIIEVGDGNVSGLSSYQDNISFFSSLYYSFKDF